ncbi:MAG: hypothetical protein JJU12_06205 [Chlamydiales bacterium]|nr:hypothetical protein [Chlamydiales bacterium]
MYLSPCFSKASPNPESLEAKKEVGALNGRKCGKAVGVAALVVGIALVILAAVMASGVLGDSNMYFAAAGLIAGAIVPFSIAACKLKPQEPSLQTLGDPSHPFKDEENGVDQ